MNITLHDAEGFAAQVRTGLHAFVTAHPLFSVVVTAILAGIVGHAF